MAAENNYEEILEEVCEKLNNIDSVKELDVLDIKNSVESIENLITDTQAKLNFEEIKGKLENIAMQVDSCNDALLKDLYTDINTLKESASSVSQHLENLQNVQNLALTSAEFEEYQKQQLDLALKTNENIFNELNAIKENSKGESYSENIKHLETQLINLHQTLTSYIEQISSKIENIPNLEDIGSIMTDLNSVQQKNIRQTNVLIKELQVRLSKFHSDFENKDFENQIAKISEIYDSLGIINAWIEKVGYINQSIENVYSRLGENIDFDDVAEKIDIIYESISALNNWTMKIDNVDSSMSDIQSKIASLSSFAEDTKNITNTLNTIKNRIDSSLSEDLDFEDLTNKMDIVYENLTAINEWANKVDNISDKVSNINNAFEDDLMSSKIDLIYENIGLLNEWVSKIDGFAQKSEELDTKYTQTNDNLNSKIDEITQTLSKASEIIDDVPNLKDKLEDLSGELHKITSTTKNDTESYIYTLLDIESDFLKLHKFLDDKTKVTSDDINSLKEKFAELNNDISSISIRTNKLILSADDANKQFKSYLDSFKDTIQELDNQRKEFNPELKFALLGEKVNEMVRLLHSSANATKNLNNAFIYLAEWIDATGSALNNMQNDISDIKNKNENEKSLEFLNNESEIKEDVTKLIKKFDELEESFVNYKTDDVSEIKSLLTGIIVQLNTALTPDIDSLNERIDKLSEENSNKLTELETLMQEKINQQSKQISALEERIETLSSKFDKLIEAMSEDSKNYEIKDILNYIATQIATTNETLANQQDNNKVLNTVAEKLSSFDENINKVVSYIEED
ncbi:TPA: hypothetical protein IAA87_08990 [Candidatus Avigastranaerophilus faecigallinarum]|nr:hypothetical protein [Candidatus Avigastranaerophilus faecigallinarum]